MYERFCTWILSGVEAPSSLASQKGPSFQTGERVQLSSNCLTSGDIPRGDATHVVRSLTAALQVRERYHSSDEGTEAQRNAGTGLRSLSRHTGHSVVTPLNNSPDGARWAVTYQWAQAPAAGESDRSSGAGHLPEDPRTLLLCPHIPLLHTLLCHSRSKSSSRKSPTPFDGQDNK